MKPVSPILSTLAICVAVLALLACVAGLTPGAGEGGSFVSIRGESVQLHGSGLYRLESKSFAAQAKAQDLVTAAVGVPLLLASLILASRGSRRGGLLLAGTFAYFAYTFATYSFGLYYNSFFLIYVALFSMGVFGLILALTRLDGSDIKAHFSGPRTRKAAIAFDFFAGTMIFLMWMGRILPGLAGGADRSLVEHYTTLPIQVMDLGLVVPLAMLAGVNLAKDKPLGYLLSGLFLMKGLTLGLALGAMILWTAVAGLPVSTVETIIFGVIIVVGIGVAAAYFKAVR